MYSTKSSTEKKASSQFEIDLWSSWYTSSCKVRSKKKQLNFHVITSESKYKNTESKYRVVNTKIYKCSGRLVRIALE